MDIEQLTQTGWWEWLTSVAGTTTFAEIARVTDINPQTIANWSKGGNVDPDLAAKAARAYGQSAGLAYVILGRLTPQDVHITVTEGELSDWSAEELATELARRAAAPPRGIGTSGKQRHPKDLPRRDAPSL